MIENAPVAAVPAPATKHAAPAPPPVYGSAIAEIEIPRIGLTTVVFEGTGQDVLSHGAGHLRGSSLPGEKGNVVVAAHRDTFFRPLRDLKVGDEITIETKAGVRRYVVDSTRVVHPDNTSVLAQSSQSILTLVTCYPFRYIGSAPDRFVARCREIRDNTQPAAPPASSASAPSIPATIEEPSWAAQFLDGLSHLIDGLFSH